MRHAEYVALKMGEDAYFAREEGFAVSFPLLSGGSLTLTLS